MTRVSLTVGAIAALLMTSTASAVTITNQDDQAFRLTVIEDTVRQETLLKPGQVIERVCQQGCIIRLNDSEIDEYELDGSERVSVEEGFLYFDGLDVPRAPKLGSVQFSSGSPVR